MNGVEDGLEVESTVWLLQKGRVVETKVRGTRLQITCQEEPQKLVYVLFPNRSVCRSKVISASFGGISLFRLES